MALDASPLEDVIVAVFLSLFFILIKKIHTMKDLVIISNERVSLSSQKDIKV